MATGNRKRVIEYIFQSTDKTSKVLKDMSQSSDAFGKSLVNVASPIAGVTKNLLALQVALAGVGIGLLSFATNEGAKFTDTLKNVQNLTGASNAEIDKFSQGLSDFSSRSVSDLDKVNKAITTIADATNQVPGALDLLAQSEKLAAATGTELQASTSGLLTTLTAFGLRSEEASRAADVLFETAKGGRLSISQLETAFAQTGGVAREFGLSIEDVGAFLSTASGKLGASGAATAFRSLRQILENLIKPSDQIRDASQKYGVAFNRGALEAQGLTGFLESLGQSSGNTAQFLTEIGIRGRDLNGILAILQDDTGALSSAFDRLSNATGAVDKAYEKVASNITFQSQQIVNAVRIAAKDFAVPFLDNFEAVLKSFQALQGALAKDTDLSGFASLQQVIADTADAVTGFLDRLTKELPAALSQVDTTAFIEALRELGSSFGGLFDAFEVSEAEGIAESFQSIVDAGTLLISFTDGFISAATPVVALFKDIFDIVSKIPAPLADIAGRIGVVSIVLVSFGGALLGVSKTLKALSFLLGGPRGSLLSALTSVNVGVALTVAKFTGLVAGAAALGFGIGTLLNKFTPLQSFLDEKLQPVLVSVAEKFPSFGRAIEGVAESLDNFSGSGDQATKTLINLEIEVGSAKDAIEGMNQSLEDLEIGTGSARDAIEGMNQSLEEATTAAEPAVNQLESFALALNAASQNGVSLTSAQELLAAGFSTTTLKVGNAIDGFREFADVITFTGTATKTASEKIQEGLERNLTESEKFRFQLAQLNLELEKTASQERIVQFEIQADLKVKEIEQGTERITQAFETIRAGIESTQEGLNSLVGGLLDASGSNRTLIRELIREEEKRRKAAFKLSEEREKAELKLLRAQTNFFRNGQSLIQVNGDNLRPHLVALFLEVLEEASIQINANGRTFLAALPQAL